MRTRFKRIALLVSLTLLLIPGCAGTAGSDGSSPAASEATGLDRVDMSKWQYEADADVYWQVGIPYCETPADESIENLGIFVPGSYMDGTENGDGTYTCEINAAGSVNGFTAQDAPIVIPVETPGYTAMSAPKGYSSSVSEYTDAGFIYVHPGCRGRDAGAPAGVTDLKAAIRYIRYNDGSVPGDTDRIFSFGMSGGGGQSALLGASGDSDLYTPYLQQIGAVADTSDAVAGSMCWCPITTLGPASEAYEWNMGVTREDLSEEMQELSDAMAAQYATYINGLGLVDADGAPLTLEESEEGIYQAGSYYDYLKESVEDSLNNFLADNDFPYTVATGKGGFGMGGRGELPEGELPEGDFGGRGGLDAAGDGDAAEGQFKGGRERLDLDGLDATDGTLPAKGGDLPGLDGEDGAADGDITAIDGIARNDTAAGTISLSGTYDTVQDYIDALNAAGEWVTYDSATNTATITSIADFVRALKPASKSLGAFDALDESQGENILFGDGDGEGDHFDAVMAELLAGTEYEAAFAEDLARTDELGNSVEYRVNMYDPLYYLLPCYAGYGTSDVAEYWRIRSGINQSDTALSTEANLALALEALGEDVDFAAVWGQAHVEAERTGDSTGNFIEWVVDSLA